MSYLSQDVLFLLLTYFVVNFPMEVVQVEEVSVEILYLFDLLKLSRQKIHLETKGSINILLLRLHLTIHVQFLLVL